MVSDPNAVAPALHFRWHYPSPKAMRIGDRYVEHAYYYPIQYRVLFLESPMFVVDLAMLVQPHPLEQYSHGVKVSEYRVSDVLYTRKPPCERIAGRHH